MQAVSTLYMIYFQNHKFNQGEILHTYNNTIKLIIPQKTSGINDNLHGDCDSWTWPEMTLTKKTC